MAKNDNISHNQRGLVGNSTGFQIKVSVHASLTVGMEWWQNSKTEWLVIAQMPGDPRCKITAASVTYRRPSGLQNTSTQFISGCPLRWFLSGQSPHPTVCLVFQHFFFCRVSFDSLPLPRKTALLFQEAQIFLKKFWGENECGFTFFQSTKHKAGGCGRISLWQSTQLLLLFAHWPYTFFVTYKCFVILVGLLVCCLFYFLVLPRITEFFI